MARARAPAPAAAPAGAASDEEVCSPIACFGGRDTPPPAPAGPGRAAKRRRKAAETRAAGCPGPALAVVHKADAWNGDPHCSPDLVQGKTPPDFAAPRRIDFAGPLLQLEELDRPAAAAAAAVTVVLGRAPEGEGPTMPAATAVAMDCPVSAPLLLSRRHAEFALLRDGTCVVADLGSTNGTFVNGTRLEPQARTVLRSADVVTLGAPSLRSNRTADKEFKYYNPYTYRFDACTCAGGAASHWPGGAPPRPAGHAAAEEEGGGPAPGQAKAKVKSAQQAELEEGLECTVCNSPFVAAHALAPCGHNFCGGCCHEWLKTNLSCPVCRVKIAGPPVPLLQLDALIQKAVYPGMAAEDRRDWDARAAKWARKRAKLTEALRRKFASRPRGGDPPG